MDGNSFGLVANKTLPSLELETKQHMMKEVVVIEDYVPEMPNVVHHQHHWVLPTRDELAAIIREARACGLLVEPALQEKILGLENEIRTMRAKKQSFFSLHRWLPPRWIEVCGWVSFGTCVMSGTGAVYQMYQKREFFRMLFTLISKLV